MPTASYLVLATYHPRSHHAHLSSPRRSTLSSQPFWATTLSLHPRHLRRHHSTFTHRWPRAKTTRSTITTSTPSSLWCSVTTTITTTRRRRHLKPSRCWLRGWRGSRLRRASAVSRRAVKPVSSICRHAAHRSTRWRRTLTARPAGAARSLLDPLAPHAHRSTRWLAQHTLTPHALCALRASRRDGRPRCNGTHPERRAN